MNKSLLIFSIIAGCLSAAISFIPIRSSAQTSNPLIITWQANNYFPADYAGKALVTPNTVVIASVEMIENGKLTDITGAEIRWYIDDRLVNSGAGLKTVSFSAKQQQSGYQALRAFVKIGNSSFENSVQVPISQPAVVINYPSPDKTIGAGGQATISVIPFFFNVDSLNGLKFDWSVNNQRTANQGGQISISVGTPRSEYQNSLPIAVTVQNLDNPYEFGRGFVNLSITQ